MAEFDGKKCLICEGELFRLVKRNLDEFIPFGIKEEKY